MSGTRHADSGTDRERWRDSKAFITPLMRHEPLISEAEMLERILRIRAEEADTRCHACGSTTPEIAERKTCPLCARELPLSAFHRDRTRADGRDPRCKECRRLPNIRACKARRTRLALERAS